MNATKNAPHRFVNRNDEIPRLPAVKNSPSMLKVLGDICQPMSLQSQIYIKLDEELSWLSFLVGEQHIMNERRARLHQIGSHIVSWLEKMNLSQEDIIEKISGERLRQREAFRSGQFNFDVGSPNTPFGKKHRVLIEEVGEVAKAIDHLEHSPQSRKRRNHLITELVQVAAVAVAWLESYEVTS